MNNLFINKDLFYKFHNKEYRKDRNKNFIEIYKILKNNLKPKDKANIDEKKLHKYISLYKKENRELIQRVLSNVINIPFNKFYKDLITQIENFNNYLEKKSIKKYIFVLGVGSDAGASSMDFNLFKSNFWVFLLGWKHLKIKPYDILLNLNVGIRLYYPEIEDYVLMDDCSYSGDQMFNQVIKVASTELMYFNKKGYIIKNETKKTIYEPVQEKLINLHLIIPYISKVAYEKITELDLTTGFNILRYNSFIVNPFKDIMDQNILKSINALYSQYYKWIDFGSLIPIFFEHKIADMISTIDLILIKGQVLDDPEKRLVFINSCEYNPKDPKKYDLNPKSKDFNMKKLYCPNPPYLDFIKILKNKIN